MAPLVMVNGVGATSVGDAKVTGTFYEGYNLLTPRFRARFTTDGKGIYFFLPQKNLANSEITGSYVMAGGQTFSFTIPKNSSVSTQSVSGLSVEVSRTGGYFWFKTLPVRLPVLRQASAVMWKLRLPKPGRYVLCYRRYDLLHLVWRRLFRN